MAAFPSSDIGVARADQFVVRAVSAYLGRYVDEQDPHWYRTAA